MYFRPSIVIGKDSKGKVSVVYAGESPDEAVTTFKDLRDTGGKGLQALALFLKPLDSMHAKFDPVTEVKPTKAIKL
mgnify:CR=1 FL=1